MGLRTSGFESCEARPAWPGASTVMSAWLHQMVPRVAAADKGSPACIDWIRKELNGVPIDWN